MALSMYVFPEPVAILWASLRRLSRAALRVRCAC